MNFVINNIIGYKSAEDYTEKSECIKAGYEWTGSSKKGHCQNKTSDEDKTKDKTEKKDDKTNKNKDKTDSKTKTEK